MDRVTNQKNQDSGPKNMPKLNITQQKMNQLTNKTKKGTTKNESTS